MKIEYLNEYWKDIKGYEGLYQVSNFGRIKSIKTNTVLKPFLSNKGYYQVSLCKNGIRKKFLVHRLVAIAFIPNPNNYKCVNHKNEITTDNFVYIDDDGYFVAELSNLEWCTHLYNMNYGHIKEKQRNAKLGKYNNKISKPILQFDLDNNYIREWPSMAEIKRQLGYQQSAICQCCKFILKSAYGYLWKYKETV